MFEDIFGEDVVVVRGTGEEKKTMYHVMKTKWDNGSIILKESYVSGEHIAEGLDKMFKMMKLPIRVGFKKINMPDGSENNWEFYLTVDREKKEN